NYVLLYYGELDNKPVFYMYAHLKNVPDMEMGQPIDAGTAVGAVGNTGNSLGSGHHHIECWYGGPGGGNKRFAEAMLID
ncbi:MAG: hypothetical protein RR284_06965, partial [Ruthenibacterium sp.]